MNARAVSSDNHDWLVEHFIERERAIKRGKSDQAHYVLGRIDEFCAQNAVTEEERTTAHRQALGEVLS